MPNEWVEWIQSGIRQTENSICEAKKFNCKPKYITGILMNKRDIIYPIANNFWKRKFDIEIDKSKWINAVYHTKETRLRVLHWKIMHNIYPTNILLKKMNVTENNKCSYCPNTVDYIEHFFFECRVVRDLWNLVEQKIMFETNMVIKISVTDVLFGVNKSNLQREQFGLLNKFLLIAKMSISMFKKTQLTFGLIQIFEKECQLRKVISS